MVGKFFVVSYQVSTTSQGQVVVANLIKETESQQTLVNVSKNVGFAGTLELHIYDPVEQERIKKAVGTEVEIRVGI